MLFARGTNHGENVRRARERELREPSVHGDPKTPPEIKRSRARTRSDRKTTPRTPPSEHQSQPRKVKTVLRGRVEVDENEFRSRRDEVKSRGAVVREGTKR